MYRVSYLSWSESVYYILFTVIPLLHIHSLTGQSPTEDQQKTKPYNPSIRRQKVVVVCFFALALSFVIFYNRSKFSHQTVKNFMENYRLECAQYVLQCQAAVQDTPA